MAAPISLSGYRPLFGLERAKATIMGGVAAVVARSQPTSTAPAPFPARKYDEVELEVDVEDRTCWCWMEPDGAPSFTPTMLKDLKAYTALIRERFAAAGPTDPAPLQHSVLASRLPGVFNLGGDLERFAHWIRAKDRESLRAYAYACIDVLHDNAIGFGNDVITIALVQGDALGGGFETALSCHMIVAERGVKFGLPEILFNLFPGMGATSLLSRRVGLAQAEKMIMSGRIYTAEELHEMGIVHVLAEAGDGVAATQRLIRQNLKRQAGLTAMYRASARVAPLPFAELRDVTDIWVDAALAISAFDLRKMERLTSAQDRRMAGKGQSAAPFSAQSIIDGAA